MADYPSISVQELAKKLDEGAASLVDVRTPTEFREVHAQHARNYPLDRLDPAAVVEEHKSTEEAPVYVICQAGSRSAMACEKFVQAGFSNVVNVEGGTKAWEAANLPVVRGKKSISLERQVRITAGSIALIGSVAAMVTGNVYFAGVPAFIGAGLTFAGLTNTCGMGMMLAKMPWNQ